ncbi:hypothetical protein P775_05755 [Puniceibacterium antarcticum]|uniref:GHMP kinase N-terminal domain-containing protein n=1 Tax=Puniceibacterium antarcticum TaxID=1206336 RepID=A0A2G8RHJ7_9RHOB|nr:hypothetical protein [Puniceibacterium antarcticum]PIL21047.1 hypothetical protein P775_05755 [Puniceibacterium antarcticum]
MPTQVQHRSAGWLVPRVYGHFGEWLQGRLGPEGPVVLVTLACTAFQAEASFEPAHTLHLRQSQPEIVTPDQLRLLLRGAALPESGLFWLSGTVPPGAGAGASTAALVALARAAGCPPERLAAACLSAEGACDPLMLGHPDGVLWASRAAQVMAQLQVPPRCEVIGACLGGPVRTDATDHDFPDISDLVLRWRAALRAGDLPELAALAAVSAQRTTRHRGPVQDPSARIAHEIGALGYARAHTGSARAFLFAPGTAPQGAEAALLRAGLHSPLRFCTGGAR